jgi:hypothetical protein
LECVLAPRVVRHVEIGFRDSRVLSAESLGVQVVDTAIDPSGWADSASDLIYKGNPVFVLDSVGSIGAYRPPAPDRRVSVFQRCLLGIEGASRIAMNDLVMWVASEWRITVGILEGIVTRRGVLE